MLLLLYLGVILFGGSLSAFFFFFGVVGAGSATALPGAFTPALEESEACLAGVFPLDLAIAGAFAFGIDTWTVSEQEEKILRKTKQSFEWSQTTKWTITTCSLQPRTRADVQ